MNRIEATLYLFFLVAAFYLLSNYFFDLM